LSRRAPARRAPAARLGLETLGERLVPASLPTTLPNPVPITHAATLNSYGYSALSGSVTRTEVDFISFTAAGTGTVVLTADELVPPSSGPSAVTSDLNPHIAVYDLRTGQRLGYNDDVSATDEDSRLEVPVWQGQQLVLAVAARPYHQLHSRFNTNHGSYLWTIDTAVGPVAAAQDDYLEENDSMNAPRDLGLWKIGTSGNLSDRSRVGFLKMRDGEDWYRFETGGKGMSDDHVRVLVPPLVGNTPVNLALYRENMPGLFERLTTQPGWSSADEKERRISLEGLEGGVYFVRVFGGTDPNTESPVDPAAGGGPDYSLYIVPPDDRYENNDSKAAAAALSYGRGVSVVTDLVMADAEDWFRFDTTRVGVQLAANPLFGLSATDAFVQIDFEHTLGNLKLEIYTPSSTTPVLSSDTSSSTANRERVSLVGLPVGTYHVRVIGVGGATNPDYDLSFSDGSRRNDSFVIQ
jgi:hypothetical protein